MGNEVEEICVQRFLDWYNRQHKGHYIHQRARDYFHNLNKNNEGDWDFVAYERDNQDEWLGIEIKELATTREVSKWFEFWKGLCLELTRDLAARGVQGEFVIIHPPVFHLESKKRTKFRETFIDVLCQTAPNMKINETIDIGPDIADKFINWPEEKSKNLGEYTKWGNNRPAELLINKCSDSGCEVTSPISPIRVQDVVKQHKKTFNEADIKHASKQLKLAKERGARETILLFACSPFVHESLVRDNIQELDSHLISNIDHIYMVNISGENRVVEI